MSKLLPTYFQIRERNQLRVLTNPNSTFVLQYRSQVFLYWSFVMFPGLLNKKWKFKLLHQGIRLINCASFITFSGLLSGMNVLCIHVDLLSGRWMILPTRCTVTFPKAAQTLGLKCLSHCALWNHSLPLNFRLTTN